MPTVDERLRELAQATHAGLEPSPELFGRIRSATTHSARPAWARPQMLVAAAAVVAVIAAVAVGLVQGHGGGREQVAAPMTRQDLITAADQACDDMTSALNNVQVVFPTADGYKAVAGAWIASTQRALDKTDAGAAPSDAQPVRAEVDADLRAALAQLHTAQDGASAGDMIGAQAAINSAQADIAKAGAALAAYGAVNCGLKP